MKQYDNYSNSAKEVFPEGKRRRKKGSLLTYFYLFVFSFIAVLLSVSYFIKKYSPDVDVAIGDKQEEIIFDDALDYEAGIIDERLKWIQSEDDIPVTEKRKLNTEISEENEIIPKLKRGRFSDETEIQKDEIISKNPVTRPPRPSLEETIGSAKIKSAGELLKSDTDLNIKEERKTVKSQNKQSELNENKASEIKEIKPLEVSVTKVYIGGYSTADEAIAAQKSLAEANPSLAPFVKNLNGKYIVQAGSFYDMQKADALMLKLRDQGFSPRKYIEK